MTGTLGLPLSGVISGVTEQGDINAALAALAGMEQSTTAPTSTSLGLSSLAGVWWHNTSTGVVAVRNQADTAWISIGTINEITGAFQAAFALTSAAIIAALGYTPATSSELAAYALILSPSLTGSPTAPTPATTDNSTRIATTAMVQAAVAAGIAAYMAAGGDPASGGGNGGGG